MQEPVTDKVAFRIRDYREPDKPRGYRRSYSIIDEQTQQTRVRCDLDGSAAGKPQEMIDDTGHRWTLAPNRKLMPSKWTLSGQDGCEEWEFRQKALGALLNPFHKTLMSVTRSDGTDAMQFVDLRGAKLPVVLGLESGEYALMRGEEALALLTRLPTEQPPEGKGLLGKFRKFMSGSDVALVSAGAEHPLPAHAVLAMYFLYREFTDVSAG